MKSGLILASLPSACMGVVAAQLPWLRLTLSPRFDNATQAVSALECILELNDTRSRAGRPLLKLALTDGPTPTLGYDNDALSVSDDGGTLQLSYTDTNDTDVQRIWVSSRDPVGLVVVRFLAPPRITSPSTLSGPRVDLRDDQGGVIGMGTGFVPYPPAEEDWEVHVHWDIPVSAPPNTQGVSSLGDGTDAMAIGHPSTVLEKSYFAAGPVQRRPPLGTSGGSGSGERDVSMYWIGSFPYDVERVSATIKRNFVAISKFFGELDSPFRVFLRRVWVGYGGAGGYQSFLMEYANHTEEELSEEALGNLIAHETIHSYALMYPSRRDDMWYREGVAVYYAVFAPFLGGAVDKQYLVRWLNNNAQGYYTSSTTALTWQTVLDKYWQSVELVKTPYGRGFIYLASVHGLISEATNGTKGLDDLVLELYQRYLVREKVQGEEFVEVLGGFIGAEKAQASFDAMANGTLIVPPSNGFAKFGLRMVRRDAEKLEQGFYGSKQVIGLVKGSRAEEAGLREGDVIVRLWALWGASDSLDNMMKVVVLRDGEDVTIQYWPRSYEKAENWEWVVDDGQEV